MTSDFFSRRPPNDVIVNAILSLNGEITSNMRAVFIGYSTRNMKFHFVVYKEPSKDDEESAEIIAVNFFSGHFEKLETLEIKFIISVGLFKDLDHLDFVLFHRKEYYTKE